MKTNSKGFSQIILIILIITVVVIIGGGVYWVVTQQAGTNQNANTVVLSVNTANTNVLNSNTGINTSTTNQNTNTVINQNANAPVNHNINASANTNSDPTADWKTYRNEKYGFEVKYPNDWNYQETGSGQTTPAGVKFSDVDFETYSPAPGIQADKLINVTLYKTQQTIDEYVTEDLASKNGSKNQEEIQVSDQRGIKTKALSENILSLAAYTRKEDYIYIFESRGTKENIHNEIETIFNLFITKFRYMN